MSGPLFALLAASAQVLPVPLGLDHHVPAPPDNPLAPAQVRLGRKLFFSKDLSADRTIACATCHDPAYAFADAKPIAVGIGAQSAGRRSPRLLNRAWGRRFFWDGRSPTLEDQVLQPVLNPKEMGLTLAEIPERTQLPPATVAQALAAYVRSIFAGDSPYDRFLAGDRGALAPEAQAGLRLFRGKANCIACHLGPQLTDESLHDTGLEPGKAFKTPGLRQVAAAPPYMHDGSLPTLQAVVDFYNDGARPHAGLDTEIRPLGLSVPEKRALVAFLRSLTGRIQEGWPASP
jgi:cytochrome c peroxidase